MDKSKVQLTLTGKDGFKFHFGVGKSLNIDDLLSLANLSTSSSPLMNSVLDIARERKMTWSPIPNPQSQWLGQDDDDEAEKLRRKRMRFHADRGQEKDPLWIYWKSHAFSMTNFSFASMPLAKLLQMGKETRARAYRKAERKKGRIPISRATKSYPISRDDEEAEKLKRKRMRFHADEMKSEAPVTVTGKDDDLLNYRFELGGRRKIEDLLPLVNLSNSPWSSPLMDSLLEIARKRNMTWSPIPNPQSQWLDQDDDEAEKLRRKRMRFHADRGQEKDPAWVNWKRHAFALTHFSFVSMSLPKLIRLGKESRARAFRKAQRKKGRIPTSVKVN